MAFRRPGAAAEQGRGRASPNSRPLRSRRKYLRIHVDCPLQTPLASATFPLMSRALLALSPVFCAALLAAACSSEPNGSGNPPTDAGAQDTGKEDSAVVVSDTGADTSVVTPDAHADDASETDSAADGGINIACTSIADCSGKTCCVNVSLGAGSFPNCGNPTGGGATCENSVAACPYQNQYACNSKVVSHACGNSGDCPESSAPRCCDVSRYFTSIRGKVCVDTIIAAYMGETACKD